VIGVRRQAQGAGHRAQSHQSSKFFLCLNLFFKITTFGMLFQAVTEGIIDLK